MCIYIQLIIKKKTSISFYNNKLIHKVEILILELKINQQHDIFEVYY